MIQQAPLSLDFNSPLLQAKSPINRPDKIRHIITRMIMTLIIVLILGGIIYGIAYRWFEPQSIGYVLYWLHDEIYLLIKGYTYTWRYPYSLLWWLTGLVLLGYWLFTYLTDTPLLRAVHIKMIRFCLYRRVLRGVLKTWIKWVKASFFQESLLEKVVEHEQKRCLHVVDTAITPNQNELHRLGITTAFKVDMHQRTTKIELLSDVINTLIRFYLYQKDKSDKTEEFWQYLYKIIFEMQLELTTFEKALTTTVEFSELSLCAEIICLFEIRNNEKLWFDGMNRVLSGIEIRSQQLSQNRIKLEQLRWRHFDKQPIDFLNNKQINSRLAVDVALLFALFSDEPNASLAYIENIEALTLTAAIANVPDFATIILSYADYRLCAELLTRAKKVQSNGLFKESDLALADASIDHFFHAGMAN